MEYFKMVLGVLFLIAFSWVLIKNRKDQGASSHFTIQHYAWAGRVFILWAVSFPLICSDSLL
jgi:hypothetical protein